MFQEFILNLYYINATCFTMGYSVIASRIASVIDSVIDSVIASVIA